MTTGPLLTLNQPDSWQWIRIGNLCTRSRKAERPDLPPLSVFLNYGVVPRSQHEADNHNRLGENLSRYLVVEPGDIVFNKLRTWQGGFGHSRHFGIVSPAYFVLKPSGTDTRFLDYLLHSEPYLAELTRRSKWMPPSQFDIGWDDLRSLPVLMPPHQTQKRIADYLDTETARIDGLTAMKRKTIDHLIERRVRVTLDAVTGASSHDRRPSHVPWLNDLPAHWEEAKLSLVASLGSGHTPSRSRSEWWQNCTIPWITTGEVQQVRNDRVEFIYETRECISELGLENSSAVLHPVETVVLSRTASAGYSGIMGRDMAVSQDFATWTCGPLLRPRFLLLCLRAMRPDLLGRLATGSTHKTIYMPDIEALRVPIPPVEEQDEVVETTWRTLSRIDRHMDTLGKQIELLAERRQSLITAAVTGELEV